MLWKNYWLAVIIVACLFLVVFFAGRGLMNLANVESELWYSIPNFLAAITFWLGAIFGYDLYKDV